MFGRSTFQYPATQNCVCSVTAGKRKATASLASGSVREHAAVQVGSGRPRENWQFHAIGMPRAQCSLSCVRKAYTESVFFSAVLSKRTCPHIDVGAEKCSLRIFRNTSWALPHLLYEHQLA